MKNSDSCLTCHYSESRQYYDEMSCRRHSPVINHKMEEDYGTCFHNNAEFPIVSKSNWCGDYIKKKESK